MSAWNRLPRGLRLAFAAWIALVALRVAVFALDRDGDPIAILELLGPAALGAQLLALVGVFQLAHRFPAPGLGLVIGGAIAQCVLSVGFYLLAPVSAIDAGLGERLDELLNYAVIIADAFAIVGWAVAARSIALGVVAAVAELVVFWSGIWGDSLPDAQPIMEALGELAVVVVFVAAALRVASGPEARDRGAPGGLGGLTAGLWIVVLAAAGLAGVSVVYDGMVVGLVAVTMTLVVGAALFGLAATTLADEPGAAGWLATVATLLAFVAVGHAVSVVVELFTRYLHRDVDGWLYAGSRFAVLGCAAVAELAVVAAVAASARRRGAPRVATQLVGAAIAMAGLFGYAALASCAAASLVAVVAGTATAAVAVGHGVARLRVTARA